MKKNCHPVLQNFRPVVWLERPLPFRYAPVTVGSGRAA